MRLSAIYNIPNFNYTRILQSHSHVTFLGWGFIATTTLFNYLFLDKSKIFNSKYKLIFILEISSVFLMLISFPLQGYKVFSIILLSIFLITSYIYIYHFIKDYQFKSIDKPVTLFIKSSLFFYILSSIGIWAIGITVATQGKTDLYYNSIYFYLHFLYNGFFVFALFGLFFHLLKSKDIKLNESLLTNFFRITFITCIPAYLLSLVDSSWFLIQTINFSIGFSQLLSIWFLIRILKSIHHSFYKKLSPTLKIVMLFFMFSFILKVVLQFVSAFPQISESIIIFKSYFVIGYIHLVTLGFLSPFVIFLLINFKLILIQDKIQKIGIFIFLIGVFFTEILLFTQGSFIWFFKYPIPNYSILLFIFSSLLLLGIASLINNKKNELEKD